ncbi:MAG TPA: hypothetical protein VFL36_20300 [Myxococcales bacterium]|nr:hypothetical protein [Myxococcales bacterium]
MESDPLVLRRAAGSVLRGLRRRGSPLLAHDRSNPLKPQLAIDALLAAMGMGFGLTEQAAQSLLGPALADWRDLVGCADPVLVPANAQGPSAEKALVPLPVPSWCAWLIDAGVLVPDGAPVLEGGRAVLRAFLAVVRETELAAVECFPVTFAARFASGAASMHVHLALSPPFASEGWRGPVSLRAAAHRTAAGRPVPLWLGPPATPSAGSDAGAAGESVATWTTASPPRWAVLRAQEGREPQALFDLDALWQARRGMAPAGRAALAPTVPVSLRIAVDIGSTSTVVVEEDTASSGALGKKLLHEPQRDAAPSGFCRLAGDPATAHLFGCGEQLLAPGGQLPTALVAANAAALRRVLAGQASADQLWLPQAGPEPARDPVRADRFKSPDLMMLSDWLAAVPDADPSRASRRLLEAYGLLLGRALAAAHATPLVAPEGGRWTLRAPRLGAVETVVTFPPCPWSAASGEPFSAVFTGVADEICAGLRSAWASASHRLVADPVAAKAARATGDEDRHPIEAFADFGGLTLQMTVRLPRGEGRPAPFIAGSSMSYLLGGERLIDSAAFAAAALGGGALREAFSANARRWRTLIAEGGHLDASQRKAAEAAQKAILGTVLSLVRRQLDGTLRRAAPDGSGLRGAGLRLYLLGEGWKLAALDAPNPERERETLRRIEAWLSREPLLAGVPVQIQRMDKRRLCEGALRAEVGPVEDDAAVELQGVDAADAQELRQRWFGVPDALDSGLSPHPPDPWWRTFAGGAGDGSLLRVEQWFTSDAPFLTRLSAGRIAYEPGRSLLKQWIDLSGPSLVALRVHEALSA